MPARWALALGCAVTMGGLGAVEGLAPKPSKPSGNGESSTERSSTSTSSLKVSHKSRNVKKTDQGKQIKRFVGFADRTPNEDRDAMVTGVQAKLPMDARVSLHGRVWDVSLMRTEEPYTAYAKASFDASEQPKEALCAMIRWAWVNTGEELPQWADLSSDMAEVPGCKLSDYVGFGLGDLKTPAPDREKIWRPRENRWERLRPWAPVSARKELAPLDSDSESSESFFTDSEDEGARRGATGRQRPGKFASETPPWDLSGLSQMAFSKSPPQEMVSGPSNAMALEGGTKLKSPLLDDQYSDELAPETAHEFKVGERVVIWYNRKLYAGDLMKLNAKKEEAIVQCDVDRHKDDRRKDKITVLRHYLSNMWPAGEASSLERRLQTSGPFFKEGVLGKVITIDYPDGGGVFDVRIVGYDGTSRFHQVSSDKLSYWDGDDFIDVIDLDAYVRDGRVRFRNSIIQQRSQFLRCKMEEQEKARKRILQTKKPGAQAIKRIRNKKMRAKKNTMAKQSEIAEQIAPMGVEINFNGQGSPQSHGLGVPLRPWEPNPTLDAYLDSDFD